MKEKALSTALGLSRDILKELRSSYIEGMDWHRVESRKPSHLWEVEWTHEGIQKLKENIGFKEPEVIRPPEQKRGTVYAKFKNPKVIGALIDAQHFNVLCKDSTKFHVGMPVDVRWDGNRWCVVRHPRFDGKY
jgi:hypothetical protein